MTGTSMRQRTADAGSAMPVRAWRDIWKVQWAIQFNSPEESSRSQLLRRCPPHTRRFTPRVPRTVGGPEASPAGRLRPTQPDFGITHGQIALGLRGARVGRCTRNLVEMLSMCRAGRPSRQSPNSARG